MKRYIFGALFSVISFFSIFSASAEDNYHKYLYVANCYSDANILDIGETGKIIFGEEYGHFVMIVGPDHYNLEEYDIVKLVFADLMLETNNIDIDLQSYSEKDDRNWIIRDQNPLIQNIRLEIRSTLPEWIKCETENNALTLTISDNDSDNMREADIDIAYQGVSETKTIHIKQAAHASLALDRLEFEMDELIIDNGSYLNKNEPNCDWPINLQKRLYGVPFEAKSELPDWISVGGTDQIIFTVKDNLTDYDRQAEVLVGYVGYGAAKPIKVWQAAQTSIGLAFLTLERDELIIDEEAYWNKTEKNRNWTVHMYGRCLEDNPVEIKSALPDWIKGRVEGYSFVFTVSDNDSDVARDAYVSVGYKGYDVSKKIHIRQEANVKAIYRNLKFDSDGLHVDKYALESGVSKEWWVQRTDAFEPNEIIRLRNTLPSWVQLRNEENAVVFSFDDNNTGKPRETDAIFGIDGTDYENTFHIRQEADVFFNADQIIDGAKYFEKKYFVKASGASLNFDILKNVPVRINRIVQHGIDGEQNYELKEEDKISINIDANETDGEITCTVGKNNGIRTEIDIDFSIGSQQYNIKIISIETGGIMPGTPSLELEADYLYVDKYAYENGNNKDWWIGFNQDLTLDHEIVLKSELPQWLKVKTSENGLIFNFDNNETGKFREADVKFGFEEYDEQVNIHVYQESDVFITDEMQEPGLIIFEPGPKNYVQPQGDTFVFKYLKNAPFRHNLTRQFVCDPDERDLQGDELIPFSVDANEAEGTITFKLGENKGQRTTIDTEFFIGSHKYVVRFEHMPPGMPSFAEQKAALEDLYQRTNGDKWTNHTNWLSDKPVAEWYGVRVCGHYLTHVYLSSNNLVGDVPNEALLTLFKTPVHFEMADNGLYGHVSDELQTMPEWTQTNNGLSILSQSPFTAGLKRLTNYKCNIRIKDEAIEYLDEADGTTTLYDLLSKHKLNYFMLGGPDEFSANMQLSYPGKFQNIVTHYPYFEDRASTLQGVNKHPFKDKSIHLWRALNNYVISSVIGTTMIIDDQGYLIELMIMDWSVDGSYYRNIVDETARKYLGEPIEHEWFKYPEDTNIQDTKNDGKYKCLHKATKEKGFDIVLMGDGFGAADNEEGARYEQLMNEAKESILSMEPLNSLRDRINVYMVNVVSQSTIVGDGNTALNYDDQKCREYAAKIPGIDMNNVAIVNITNRLQWEGSSYCNINSEGWSVSHIVNGGVSPVLNHEVCGHGIGRFLDEYILGGYYDNKLSEQELADLRSWLDVQHSMGVGLNVDYHSDPKEVAWNQMLEDERYAGLVGMYQGAYKSPYDLWRSTENSLMGTANSTMSAVQRMIVYKRIMSLTEGPDWEFDYETFVIFDSKNR